ncbi:cytochrome bc1 complex cytochrome b subunit [Nonomuraea gerenzanensis]|uniref:Cytochrome bc1 complex cytochrome b subunit n=1 Tax=Nonomuraea gerenzanensis TaxID=93944 RepID=A0A1M4E4Q6_9ACTN|nr:ubiquinol-cytochrome c reductase cytochrome b subunit [Nonomuraea gerenzanensis]UBU15975.1 ubiquinol-cytochrome c reductase cytochrome b subunit [Nonomuraea gerenzanensis]SBO93773.1 Ubiquinol--cytochrome c reductase, cytochrome B subunit [Nonomuraea gerenzanensis]
MKGSSLAGALDDRIGGAGFLKKAMRKIFPDHWTFLLGEIALYAFVVILLTGVFLTLFFKPSMKEVVYDGAYVPLRGVMMSEAYASSLEISFEVRGGLLMRQMHHWATLIFLAAIVVHALRNFFTGAFRKPRDLNWLIGVLLFVLVMFNGLFGYSLPDDLLSGAGLRILHGVTISIPLVGTYLAMFLFGGEFPGEDIIARLFSIHVLLIPGILLVLLPLHAIVLTWRQTHTQFRAKGLNERVVRGAPFYPAFLAKTTVFFLWVTGVVALLATVFQINPIWLYGPYMPGHVSAGSQPDWYMGFLEGALRIMPPWEFTVFGQTVAMSVVLPALAAPGLLFVALAGYPFVERWVTRDRAVHHLLDRPRDVPVRAGLGVAGVVYYGVLWAAGGNDLIATTFHISLYATTWIFRVAVVAGPVLGFVITRRICLGLRARDRHTVAHGVETGVIVRSVEGGYTEVERPADEEETAVLVPPARPELPAPAGGDVPPPAKRRLQDTLQRTWHS